jgi:hypothetical protein
MDVFEKFAGNESLGLGLDAVAKDASIYSEMRKGYGAGGRTRTDMSVTSPDFESGAYTNFATPAFARNKIIRRVVENGKRPGLPQITQISRLGRRFERAMSTGVPERHRSIPDVHWSSQPSGICVICGLIVESA